MDQEPAHSDFGPPPHDPPHDPTADPPKWPLPVGILSIVFGSLSLICGGLSLVSSALMPQVMEMAASEGADPMPMPDFGAGFVLFSLLAVLWQIPLVIAGITTVMRRPLGRPMHLLYAVGYLPLAIVSSAMGLMAQLDPQYQRDLEQWMADNVGATGGTNPIFGIAGGIFGLAISLVWPIFCLAWFGPKARSERALTGPRDDLI